jgi:hypothetical protein
MGGVKAKYPMGKVFTGLNRRTVRWSRVICFLHERGIPEGFEVSHMCQYRDCGNPGHLKALPRALHRSLDAYFRRTRKAVQEAGLAFGIVIGRISAANAPRLDAQSSSEVAKSIAAKFDVPMGLAKQLAKPGADFKGLVECNQGQFQKLIGLFGSKLKR